MMWGLPWFTWFMVFVFWPVMVLAAALWGVFAFRNGDGR
ncbi:hypothetical protein C8P63_11795 [Melghirimyces profundicolus]|uniref:Uncharacterized protein n=1 Tax=Melghirimyces profundicolus TaxID=1242148 RepID=A0A2T6BQU8_9BACL|nr:hypothetical protein C8P63_11795 [Melghirimyces profundicolus]